MTSLRRRWTRRIAWRTSIPRPVSFFTASDGSIEDRALVAPDRNNFGPRLGVVYKANAATVIRGGLRHLLQHRRADGVGRSAVVESARVAKHQHHGAWRIDHAGAAFCGTGSRRTISTSWNINYRSLLLRTAQRDGKSSMFHQFAVGFERQISASFVASADAHRIAWPQHHAAAKSESAGQRQWGAAVSELRRDPVPRPCGRKPLSRSRPLAREALQQRPQLPRVIHDRRPARQHARASLGGVAAPAEHERSRCVGRRRATTTSGIASSAASSRTCRSASNPILRDWLVAGILTAHTGRPFTVTQGSLEGAGWVPNRVAETEGPKTVDQWFNVTDFQVVPAGTFGNAGQKHPARAGLVHGRFQPAAPHRDDRHARGDAALRRVQRDQPHEFRQSRTLT